MKQIKLLQIVTFLLIMTSKGMATSFSSNIKLYNSENDTITHYVGEQFGGGVVFFVDKSGIHGLICSMSDIRDPDSYRLYNKQDPRPLKGRSDSAIIINQVFAISNRERAQELCENYKNSNYGTGVFSDWYLPKLGITNDV